MYNPIYLLTAVLLGTSAAAAPILVEGISDRANVTGDVSFRIVSEAGYVYQSTLDEGLVTEDLWVPITRPGYHQIDVARTPAAGGTQETARVRFNIYDPVRGSAEWGLFPWTPLPGIHSASDEFAGAELAVVAPAAFPAGRPIPWIVRVEDTAGHGKRLNGEVALAGLPDASIPLKRGVGQTFLPGQPAGSTRIIDASVHSALTQHTIAIDTTTSWTDHAGDLAGDTTWPTNGRIHVTGDLRIPVGMTLTVKPGCVVTLDSQVNITVDGTLAVQGTRSQPAVFIPTTDSAPWGGFLLYESTSRAWVNGAIFVGSGAVANWMSANGYDAHRNEQALFLLDTQSEAELTNVCIVASAGQAFHGKQASLTLDHVLVREASTVGQFNNSTIIIRDSALIDFPYDDDTFEDGDNDAMYFNQGSLNISHTLIGWTKDDGVDAGGGGGGTVTISNCWFEATFHEGMALSGSGKQITVRDTVFTQCGQGVEVGYDSPHATADHCLLVDNQVGLRFGDNYDWSYSGFLRATNCISIHNDRDLWNMCHDIWAPRPHLVDVQGNWQRVADPAYPENFVWDPTTDAALLSPFIAAASAPGRVGIGFPQTGTAATEQTAIVCVPVSLSRVSVHTVTVDYVVGGTASPGEDFALANGTLTFPPGSVRQTLCFEVFEDAIDEPAETVEILLTTPVQGEVSIPQSTYTYLIGGGLHFVSPTGGHQPPFNTWADAATNLQAAIDAAAGGATVLVTNGYYLLDAPVSITRGVTVRSLSGPAATVVDGDDAHRCFTLAHADAVVDGFTITRGFATSGGGVYIDANGTVQNCLIISNAVAGTDADGGGITCRNGGNVHRCTVRDNRATDDAGGIYCYAGGNVTDCVITGNTTGDKGGGVYLRNGGTVEHCTLTDNSASLGGGLYTVGASARNSIFYFNSAGSGSNVYNSGSSWSYVGCCSQPALTGSDNFTDDPLFVSAPGNDVHVQAGSPCIDAGTAPTESTSDHDGLPRPLDGNQDGSAIPDVGAYEYLHPQADSDGDSLPDGWEWDHGLNPADADGDQGADGDPDLDGGTNREEWEADTDPGDPQSLLAILDLIPEGPGIRVMWIGGRLATQILERRDDLTNGSPWTPVFTNQPPTSISVSHPDPAATESAQFYRIHVSRP